jgi:hypothetical protein
LAPAEINNEEGALRKLPWESVIFAPPAGAALLNVTVQELEPEGFNAAGLQASEDTSAGDTRLMVVVAEVEL